MARSISRGGRASCPLPRRLPGLPFGQGQARQPPDQLQRRVCGQARVTAAQLHARAHQPLSLRTGLQFQHRLQPFAILQPQGAIVLRRPGCATGAAGAPPPPSCPGVPAYPPRGHANRKPVPGTPRPPAHRAGAPGSPPASPSAPRGGWPAASPIPAAGPPGPALPAGARGDSPPRARDGCRVRSARAHPTGAPAGPRLPMLRSVNETRPPGPPDSVHGLRPTIDCPPGATALHAESLPGSCAAARPVPAPAWRAR
jgi:hypothetical protein